GRRRRQGRWRQAGASQRLRHRQAGGRTDRIGYSCLSQTRALPGQRCALQRRVHLPQGRQEEVGTAAMANINDKFKNRRARVRRALKRNSNGRPRLSIHRSSENIYAQVIDDVKGVTLAAASTLEKDVKGGLKTGADKAAAA